MILLFACLTLFLALVAYGWWSEKRFHRREMETWRNLHAGPAWLEGRVEILEEQIGPPCTRTCVAWTVACIRRSKHEEASPLHEEAVPFLLKAFGKSVLVTPGPRTRVRLAMKRVRGARVRELTDRFGTCSGEANLLVEGGLFQGNHVVVVGLLKRDTDQGFRLVDGDPGLEIRGAGAGYIPPPAPLPPPF